MVQDEQKDKTNIGETGKKGGEADKNLGEGNIGQTEKGNVGGGNVGGGTTSEDVGTKGGEKSKGEGNVENK